MPHVHRHDETQGGVSVPTEKEVERKPDTEATTAWRSLSMGNCSSAEADKTPAMKMHEKRTLREKEQRAAGEQPRNSLAFGTSVYNGNGSSMRVSHRRPSASPQQQQGSMTSYASSRRLSVQPRPGERCDDTSCTCSEVPPSEHPVVFADTSTNINNNPVKASPSGASTTLVCTIACRLCPLATLSHPTRHTHRHRRCASRPRRTSPTTT